VSAPIYKCELCGSNVVAELADLHEVGGKLHAFCSPEHRLEWLEIEAAVTKEQESALQS
jgi:hypothetical protein